MKTAISQMKAGAFILCFCASFLFSFANKNTGVIDPAAQAEMMQRVIQRYSEIQRSGGWQAITSSKKQIKPGESGPVVKQLKKRLQATGDLSAKDTSSVFTPALEAAVRKVQRQFGFAESGMVDAAFIRTLNVPVEKRLEQLQVNLARLQTATPQTGGKRIVVNIPDYKLFVYEGNNLVFDMNVVVGKPDSKTEVFDDELTHIVFSPYWNVPPSIVKNEILPAIKRNRRYLSSHGYEITGHEGGLPVIRQKPGGRNSLGLVKFLFPNHHAIYFHDTPAKTLFGNRTRAYSHGCVRLQDPARLAEYLLKEDPSWPSATINSAMHGGKEQWVKLTAPAPVHITYFTAWVDPAGVPNFREDIYQLDNSLPLTAVNR